MGLGHGESVTLNGVRVTRLCGGITTPPLWVAGDTLPAGDPYWHPGDDPEGGASWVTDTPVSRFELRAGQHPARRGDTRARLFMDVFDRTRPPIVDDWLARAQGWPGVNPVRVDGGLHAATAAIAALLVEEAECTSSS